MENIFFKALKFAGSNPNGFTMKELEEHLGIKQWGPLGSEFGQKRLFYPEGNKGNEVLYWLSKSGLSLLSEIEQAEETRRNANTTRAIAIISIALSICAILLQYFGTTTIRLSDEQYKLLNQSTTAPN